MREATSRGLVAVRHHDVMAAEPTTAEDRESVLAEAPVHGVPLIYLIKQVELAVRQRLDEVAAEQDLTAVQYTALTVLERHPGMTSAELARNSFVRAQTMAEMITYLVDAGLVERERDPANRRQYLLSLTRKGQTVVDRLRGPVAAIEKEMVQDLDRTEVTALRRYLMSCRRSLHEHPVH
jgi:DNA-binding MarR family transcriptional regulator